MKKILIGLVLMASGIYCNADNWSARQAQIDRIQVIIDKDMAIGPGMYGQVPSLRMQIATLKALQAQGK